MAHAQLYASPRFPGHWIARDVDVIGVWVIWPAIADGWDQREVFRDLRTTLTEVAPRRAYGTGWPRAPGRGRAPRAGVAADRRVTIRLTPAELELYQRVAGEQPLGEWIRARCNASVGLLEWARSFRARAPSSSDASRTTSAT